MQELTFTWDTGAARGAMIRCLKSHRIPYDTDRYDRLAAPIGPGGTWILIDYKHVTGNLFKIKERSY